jgi:hypothetical protein
MIDRSTQAKKESKQIHWYFLQLVPIPEVYIVPYLGYCPQEPGRVFPIPCQCELPKAHVHPCLQLLLRRQPDSPTPDKTAKTNAENVAIDVQVVVNRGVGRIRENEDRSDMGELSHRRNHPVGCGCE